MPVLRWQETVNEIFREALLDASSQPAHVSRGDTLALAASMTAAVVLRAVMRSPEWALGLLEEGSADPDSLRYQAWINSKADALVAANPVAILNRARLSS
jgi:hypothetical protein